MATAAKVNFETNIPQVLALQFAEGKAVASQYNGEEIMFTLVDGRRMYLAPFVAEKLKGIPANKPFEICKREVSRGKIEYQVRPIEETRAAASSWQSPAAHAHAPIQEKTQTSNASPQHNAPSPIAIRLCAALCAAVDAALETEVYAENRNMKLEFAAEDIRALAITVFIDQCKQNGGAR